jgi:hypothetical protein
MFDALDLEALRGAVKRIKDAVDAFDDGNGTSDAVFSAASHFIYLAYDETVEDLITVWKEHVANESAVYNG